MAKFKIKEAVKANPVKAIAGALLAPVTGGASLLPTYSTGQGLIAQQKANDANIQQMNQQAADEKARYQSIVDANFSDVAKKRGMFSKSGSSLYGAPSGSGLYSL